MAKIIWAGNTFFGPCLADLGHEVFYIRYPGGTALHWDDILAAANCSAPDLFVLGDVSAPPFVLGVESFPCLTAFYCVDSHVHSWYPNYAQAFDLCLVSLKDHLPSFSVAGGMRLPEDQVFWCPPYELHKITDCEKASATHKEWDLLFIGKVNSSINPERSLFFQKLKSFLPSFHWQSGNFRNFFPKAKLVLNHCINSDLNFRVMEALACGSCLLTPKIGHGLQELFTDGADLFMYDQDDLPSLCKLVNRLLKDPDLCAKAAANGLKKVNNKHLGFHRAILLSDTLQNLRHTDAVTRIVQNRLLNQNIIHSKYLKFIYLLLAESIEIASLQSAYLRAAKT
jgi:hypothetical protein